jgi:hypothetical protein
MSIGFNATLGTANSDKITVSYASIPTQFTVSCRFYPRYTGVSFDQQTTNICRIFDQSINSGNVATDTRRTVYYSNTSKCFIFGQRWSGATAVTAWNFPNNTFGTNLAWNSIIIRYDASSPSNIPIGFFNGTKYTLTLTTAAATGSILTDTNSLVIGNRGDNIRCFDGQISEFAYWSRLLSDDECYGLQKSISPRVYPRNRMIYLPLRRNIACQSGNTATVVGTQVQPHGRVLNG